jgi:hypothetical protein
VTVSVRLWRWCIQAYALLCIAVVIAIWVFHAAHPQYQGIPRWLFIFVQLPAMGIEILPVILLIDIVLAVKGVHKKRTFVVQAILLVIAFGFCLEGLRQSPPPPPDFGITVRGACHSAYSSVISRCGRCRRRNPDRQLAVLVTAGTHSDLHVLTKSGEKLDQATNGKATGSIPHEQ